MPDTTVIYYFAENDTTQTTKPNGLNIYRFSNGQLEVHHIDNRKEIYFPDGTIKNIMTNGVEETYFKDGIY